MGREEDRKKEEPGRKKYGKQKPGKKKKTTVRPTSDEKKNKLRTQKLPGASKPLSSARTKK